MTKLRRTAFLLAMLVAVPVKAQLSGRVEPHTFVGPVLGNTVQFNIYLPEGYDAGNERYPVVYFLHGMNGNQSGPSNTVVPQSYELARAAGVIGPVIVVFPNGYLDSLWADSIDGLKPAETDVVEQLIPYVDANFRTRNCAGSRVITGFSMGGFGAPKFYAKFPEPRPLALPRQLGATAEAHLRGRSAPVPRMRVGDEDRLGDHGAQRHRRHPATPRQDRRTGSVRGARSSGGLRQGCRTANRQIEGGEPNESGRCEGEVCARAPRAALATDPRGPRWRLIGGKSVGEVA